MACHTTTVYALALLVTLPAVGASHLRRQNRTVTVWEPTPCDEVAEGMPCYKLYEHPAGSEFVTPCPVTSMKRPDACAAQFGDKPDAAQCPQIYCPKALGVTMKLVCSGQCCPTCWAPDHVVSLDRHTSIENYTNVVPVHPEAPATCRNVKCFKLLCGTGYTEGYLEGNCCRSCVASRA